VPDTQNQPEIRPTDSLMADMPCGLDSLLGDLDKLCGRLADKAWLLSEHSDGRGSRHLLSAAMECARRLIDRWEESPALQPGTSRRATSRKRRIAEAWRQAVASVQPVVGTGPTPNGDPGDPPFPLAREMEVFRDRLPGLLDDREGEFVL
jgi:hypothetical protein